jgi:hypothetical protein
MAWAYTLTLLVIVFPGYLIYALRTVGVRCRDWLAQLRISAPATAGMATVVIGCRWLLGGVAEWPDLPLLVVEVSVGVLTYTALAWREIRWYLREGLRT